MPIDKVLWPGKPATEEQIAEFEKIEGVTLPTDYRAFLQTYNGGRPIPGIFRFGANPGSLLDSFFELGEGEGETDDLQSECDRYSGKIPPTLMPIARVAGGNIILLGVHGEPCGRVYFFDHMDPRPIFEIAPSFTAFLDSFEPRPEVDTVAAFDLVDDSTNDRERDDALVAVAHDREAEAEVRATTSQVAAGTTLDRPTVRSTASEAVDDGKKAKQAATAASRLPRGADYQSVGDGGDTPSRVGGHVNDQSTGAGANTVAERERAENPLHGDVVGELASNDTEALERRLGTKVELDPNRRTGVEVVLHVGEMSEPVTILSIKAARRAKAADVLAHQRTIELLQSYNEAWGRFCKRSDDLRAFFSARAARPGSEEWNTRMDAEKVRRIAASRRHALTHAPTGALEPILADEIAFLDEAAATFDASLDSFEPPPPVE